MSNAQDKKILEYLDTAKKPVNISDPHIFTETMWRAVLGTGEILLRCPECLAVKSVPVSPRSYEGQCISCGEKFSATILTLAERIGLKKIEKRTGD